MPGVKKPNPLEAVDIHKPLTKEQLTSYNSWLDSLVEFPLDVDDVHSICAHCRFGDLGIVQARDLLIKVFNKEMLLSEDYINPSKAGFDPRNRDDLGGNWYGVHEPIATIKRVGWSDEETKNAVCVQIILGNTEVE